MNEKTLKMLEYNKIIEKLRNYAIIHLTKEKCNELKPEYSINKIKKMQQETSEAVSVILRAGSPPIADVCEFEKIVKKVKIGSVLTIKELLDIAFVLKVMREVKEKYQEFEFQDLTMICDYFEALYSNLNVEKEIYRCIKNDEELDDRASTSLYDIRRHILDAEGRIKEKLNSIIHSSNTSKYLQDQVITFRNDRYVIPVKQEYKNEIKGLVHDSSSSGSTIFIEPTAIFNINNEIKELKIKEQIEIERILSILTQMIEPIVDTILYSINTLVDIDFAFAKAKLSLEMDAFEPKLNENEYINLKNARHPLIEKEKVVPIDVKLGKDYKILVVTGPNTGGKTVTLKTIGLLALMTQSGLHIPASESSEMAIFSHIYADIGDEQSIEQSLSTFSSHIKNVIEITNNVTGKDLVLLDELGAGTDPIEGAAIAMAILEYLKKAGAATVATTHYSELKTYAMQTKNVENASSEFDIETLRPTYKLLIGVPGSSKAFAISEKLGLSSEILNNANNFLDADAIRFEEILEDMERNRRKAKEQKEASDKLLSDAKQKKEKADIEAKDIEERKNDIIRKAKQEARDILLEAEDEANEIIKELTILKKEKKKNANAEAEKAREKLKGSISKIQKDLIKPKHNVKNVLKESDIKKGMIVYVPLLENEATIISMPDKKGKVMIQAGIMKLEVHISELEKIKETKSNSPNVNIISKVKSKSKEISTEVKLLGMTVEEATNVLDKYLDDAYLAGIKTVRVVHGKGSGLLRKGVQEYLRKNQHVESFRLGMYGEGDSGVTIVELK